jgi:hypothetical protein
MAQTQLSLPIQYGGLGISKPSALHDATARQSAYAQSEAAMIVAPEHIGSTKEPRRPPAHATAPRQRCHVSSRRRLPLPWQALCPQRPPATSCSSLTTASQQVTHLSSTQGHPPRVCFLLPRGSVTGGRCSFSMRHKQTGQVPTPWRSLLQLCTPLHCDPRPPWSPLHDSCHSESLHMHA